jgi:hypothetical protein
MEPKKSNHQANVVRVGAIRPHPDPETTKLELTDVGGYQLVIGKGQYKEGDLAVYIQPDSVVPQTEPFRFIWNDHVGVDGIVPEARRRITVRRFRKEWSEGLLMPIAEVLPANDRCAGWDYEVGTDVSDLLGITHWVPAFDKESTVADTAAAPKRKYPRSLKGWCFWTLHKLGLGWGWCGRALAQEVAFDYPVYDVDAYKNHKNWMPMGTPVQATEKIHGSNMRATFTEGVFYVGSHEQWKKQGDNVWWKATVQHPEIEVWCREHPGWVLYGEVGPTQKDRKNKEQWRYGCGDGEVFFFAYHTYDQSTNVWEWAGTSGFGLLVPVLYTGPLSPEVLALADGVTTVPGAKGIREGIVIRKIGDTTQRNNLKVVSNEFLAKDAK